MAPQRGCHCLAHSAGRWSPRGRGPACALCSEEGLDLWPPWHGGVPFIVLPPTRLPSLHPHPAFASPAAFTVTLPLSAFPAALQTIRLLTHRCEQLPVHVAASLWSPLNPQWPRVKTRLWINVIICVLGAIKNSISISKFTGKVTYITLHTIKANSSLIIALFVPSFMFFFLTRLSLLSCVRFVYIVSLFTSC